MIISEVTNFLESIAPLAYQESYDNCGLLIGNNKNEVTKVLLTLDVTEEVIDEAIDHGCNLVIAHHPLIFSGLKRINGNDFVERTVIKAIKNDVAVYAIHTNLDNMIDGVNDKICDLLELSNRKILNPKSGTLSKLVTFVPPTHAELVQKTLWEAGAGEIGNYSHCSFVIEGSGTFKGNHLSNPYVGSKNELHTESESRIEVIFPSFLKESIIAKLKTSHPYEEAAYDIYQLSHSNQLVGAGMIGLLPQTMEPLEWLKFLKSKMNLTFIKYTSFKKSISKIAVCGGSGSFLLNDAIKSGADAFVTADFKYHEYFNSENQLMICDIGHFESEKHTPELLMAQLLKKFPTFAAQISSINTNPVKYFI